MKPVAKQPLGRLLQQPPAKNSPLRHALIALQGPVSGGRSYIVGTSGRQVIFDRVKLEKKP